MKKSLHVLPILIVVGAVLLCLSVDATGNLYFVRDGQENNTPMLFETTSPGTYKQVIEYCQDEAVIVCDPGAAPCTPTTCSHTTAQDIF